MEMKNLKNMKVQTDCGEITVREYDDEIANGVQIWFNDTLVAMVDCYRKDSAQAKDVLPKEEIIRNLNLDQEEPDSGTIIGNYLSDKYGYSLNSFCCHFEKDYIHVYDIDWDLTEIERLDDVPEARLLIYGPEECELDEPVDVITLN